MPEVNPVEEVLHSNAEGRLPFLLICEHASNFIPESFGQLGLSDDLARGHIAWDPGALPVSQRLSKLLDAELVAAKFSRLLYDCNRSPDHPGAIVDRSEIHDVPGNKNLSAAEKANRVEMFYKPFELAVRRAMAGRDGLVTIHSFTPVYNGVPRDVELGVICDADSRLADAILTTAADETSLTVRRNDPYGPQDGVTHTLKHHGLSTGKPNVMLEVRNDLIASAEGQAEMATILAPVLIKAFATLSLEREPVGVSS